MVQGEGEVSEEQAGMKNKSNVTAKNLSLRHDGHSLFENIGFPPTTTGHGASLSWAELVFSRREHTELRFASQQKWNHNRYGSGPEVRQAVAGLTKAESQWSLPAGNREVPST